MFFIHFPQGQNAIIYLSDPTIPVNFQGADILFIVDSSAGVSPNNYEMEKELVKNLIKVLNSPQVNSRTAFITYGNTARVVYDLDNDMDAEELQRAIDSAQQMGGGRRTDRALDEGLRIMRNSRGSAPKIVLLITAGRQILVRILYLQCIIRFVQLYAK